MSDHETHPPLTAADFEGVEHLGVHLIEDENATWVVAFGHVDPDDFAAAVNAYDSDATGIWGRGEDYTAEDVWHRYAVATAPAPEWWITTHGVDASTPNAFPITGVTR